jgi:hypothetical protein
MPPRFSYWTIIAGGLPTAFRAADRDELMPTFTRLKEKQPDAEMKWFARGKLWASPEEAREHSERHRDGARGNDRRDARGAATGTGRSDRPREPRGKDWRPGGEHRDPRQDFADARKARNQRFKAEKFARRSRQDDPVREKPHGDPLPPDRRPGRPEGRPPREAWQRDSRPDRDAPRQRDSRPAGDSRPSRDSWPRRDDRRPQTPRDRDAWHSRDGQHRDSRPPRDTRPPRESWQRDSRPDRDTPRQRDSRPAGDSRPSRDSWPRRDDRRPQTPRDRDARHSRDGQQQRDSRQPRDTRPPRESWQRDSRPQGDRSNARRPDTRDSRTEERGRKPHKHGSFAPRSDWNARPPRDKPQGDKPTRPAQHADRDRKPFHKRENSGGREQSRESKPGGSSHGGKGHGSNSWKPKPPRHDSGSGSGAGRPFAPRSFQRDRLRGGGTEEPPAPPRPRGPNREPGPSEQPPPSAPPRPSEPITTPPGPPERGRLNRNKRSR